MSDQEVPLHWRRTMKALLAVATILALSWACSDSRGESRTGHRPSPGDPSEATMMDLGATDRETFYRWIQREVVAINQEIMGLEAKVSEMGRSASEDLRARLEELSGLRAALEREIQDFKGALAQDSAEVRRSLIDSCRRLQEAIKQALESRS